MSSTFTPIPERTENDVEANCIGWLQSLGWIAERNHVGLFYTRDGRPVPVGRPGACDWRLKRSTSQVVHYLELEVKAPGKKPDKRQLEYMAAMHHAGVLVLWADSLEMLVEKYDIDIHNYTDAVRAITIYKRRAAAGEEADALLLLDSLGEAMRG